MLGAPARRIAAALACVALTGLFVVRGFPYDLLAARISAWVAEATPFELAIGELGPSFSLLGPGVQASGVRVTAPGGAGLRIDRLRIRPAWSFAWLLLRPAFHVGAEFAGGSVDGTLGTGPSFAGSVGALDLEQLPVAVLWPGAALTGHVDADLDVRATPEGPAGSISLAAQQGSAKLPRLPIPLPFETLSARLALGGDALATVEELHLQGPAVEAQVTGSLGPAPTFGQAPLDLRVELAVDSGLRAGLEAYGVPLRPDGRGSLHVTGTPARPVLQ